MCKTIENPLEDLEQLVGGKLVASRLTVGADCYPEEIGPFTGPTDRLDALKTFTDMGDVAFAILTKRISAEAIRTLHRHDEEVVRHDLEHERQMS